MRVRVAGFLFAAVLVACVALSGCAAGKPSAGDGELSMQFAGPPVSMNPALSANGGSVVFLALAYDPLIYLAGDGRLVPDLAQSWRYVDADNTVFQLRLRPGVRFADGSPMTADAVVGSMRYFVRTGGPLAGQIGRVSHIDAVDPETVQVTYASPNPDAAMTLTQYYGIGLVISPAGVAHPDSLLTQTFGTGQYVYDAAASISGNRYVYRRNGSYWNPAAQQWRSVVVQVIEDPNSVLAAIQTRQVAFAGGSSRTAPVAASSGLGVVAAPFFNWSLLLVDAGGTICPPLADQRVRQAIGYAIDRVSFAKALGEGYGAPSSQVLLPGTDGYVPGYGYHEDLDRARQLLAEAGYPQGFTLPVLAQSIIDPQAMIAQAVAGELNKIGIKVRLTVISTGIAQFTQVAQSTRFPAVLFPSAGSDMFQLAGQVLAPGSLFNPFRLEDGPLQSDLAQAYAAHAGQRTALYQQANRRLTDLAWFVPIMQGQNIYYHARDLTGLTASVANANPIPTAPEADLAWRGNS